MWKPMLTVQVTRLPRYLPSCSGTLFALQL